MSKQEKLEQLNALRVTNGQKPLKGWKQSNDKLDETIEALQIVAGQDANSTKSTPVAKDKGNTFVGVIRPLILEGLTNKEIFDKVSGKRSGFFDQTKKDGTVVENGRKWHIAWHRADMIRKGAFTPKA